MPQVLASENIVRPWPGLDKFHLVAEIGRGGMADVYLAVRREGPSTDQRLVIKQLRSDVAEDEDFQVMFTNEARLALQLVHPNVVRTFEVGKDDDRCFIVMEFLDGQPLSRVRRRGWQTDGLQLMVQLRILSDVLAGLHYVHERKGADGKPLGVVHRDVSPPNVFVTYDGMVKVVDFGIAKAATALIDTRVGVVKGKISYMAPEHARGEVVDRRSDIFSVGVMLWEAVNGKRFWKDHDDLAIYRRLLAGSLPRVSEDEAGHSALRSVLDRALAVEVDRRFATALEMRAALEHAIQRMGSQMADQASVGRCVGELFVREKIEFHTAMRAELARLKAGRPGVPPSILSRSQPALRTETYASSVRSTGQPTMAGVSATKQESVVNFRKLSRASRAGVWLAASAAVAAAGWFLSTHAGVHLRSKADNRELPAAAIGEMRAVTHESVPALAEAAAPGSTGSAVRASFTSAPAPSVVAWPAKRPARAPVVINRVPPWPATPATSVTPPLDGQLKRQPHAKRSLDEGDPWAE